MTELNIFKEEYVLFLYLDLEKISYFGLLQSLLVFLSQRSEGKWSGKQAGADILARVMLHHSSQHCQEIRFPKIWN
jgi:hypothetical protein